MSDQVYKLKFPFKDGADDLITEVKVTGRRAKVSDLLYVAQHAPSSESQTTYMIFRLIGMDPILAGEMDLEDYNALAVLTGMGPKAPLPETTPAR